MAPELRVSSPRTIKRTVKRPFNLDAWIKRVQRHPLSEPAIRAIEEQVARRHRPSGRGR